MAFISQRAIEMQVNSLMTQEDYYRLKAKLRFFQKSMLPAFDREVLNPLLKETRKELVEGIKQGINMDGDHLRKNLGNYAKWKAKQRPDAPPLIFDGNYVNSIVVRGRTGGGTKFKHRGIGFRSEKYMPLGIVLEYGGKPSDSGLPQKYPRANMIKRVAARPHWQPAWKYLRMMFPKKLEKFSQRYMRRK